MIALAAVGRERENPRSERSEPAALKVQLGEVAASGTVRILEENTIVDSAITVRFCIFWSGGPFQSGLRLQ